MALKVDYVAKEAAINLRRNLTLTFATVITVAIALTLVGASLLMRQGVARSNVKFHGDIQAIVYMNPTASADQITAVDSAIKASPHVKSSRYLDKHAAYQEFLDFFYKDPAIQKSLTEQDVPTSYKLQFNDASAEVVTSIQDQFTKLPGVYQVVSPTEQVKKREDSFGRLSTFSLVFAAIVGVTSLVLIINSIRIAMF